MNSSRAGGLSAILSLVANDLVESIGAQIIGIITIFTQVSRKSN